MMRVMSTKSQTQIPRQILEEACEWFVDFRMSDVDGPARERFDRWVRQSPQHIQAYLEVTTTYVGLPPPTAALPIDVNELIARARSGNSGDVVPLTPQARRPGTQTFHRRRQLLAACVAIAAIGATLFTWIAARNQGVYTTGIGEERSITLTDGSIVDLNARSRISVHFTKSERDVDLIEGQALFIVARNPRHPFIVRSHGALVRAVGTQFDVNREVTGTVVTVLEGRVAVSAGDTPSSVDPSSGAPQGIGQNPTVLVPRGGANAPLRPVLVSAGQQVTIAAEGIPMPRPADLTAATAWRRHQLIFDSSRLADVVDEFNRYNHRQLVIDSPSLDELEISGVYASTDPSSFVRFLRELPNVVVTYSEGEVHLAQRR
jgi:transmembrane sensor